MGTQHLKVGDLAPDFTLTSDTGEQVTLSDYRGKKVIIFFYPKDDTPGCTKQACSFRDEYVDIDAKNAVIFGISADDIDSHRRFKSKYNLPYLLLADVDHQVSELYGVWGKQKIMLFSYTGILRSHFVVDEQGYLSDVQYNVDAGASAQKAKASLGLS
jgi:Peroxiredoxin